jgi:HSP20 family protein
MGGTTMTWKDLARWGENRSASATSPPLCKKAASLALHQQMNRLVDNVTRNFGSGFGFPIHFGWPGTWPHFEASESDKEIAVVAEPPGFEKNDVEVWVHDGGLTLKGDKREQKENDGGVFSNKRERKPFRRWLRLSRM